VRDNVSLASVEPFISIVAQLELSTDVHTARTLLVTSTVPGEGKSMIASNLAAAFTRIGKRTLLVDADFRRPIQDKIHGLPANRGFLAWARCGFPQENLLCEASPLGIRPLADGTHLLPSGGDDPQPIQYLVSHYTAALYEQLRLHYDVLILDTPPAGYFQDALVLTRYVHNTILVARESKASVATIRRVIDDIDKTSAPILGLILNDFSFHNVHPRLKSAKSYESYYAVAANGRSEHHKKAATIP